ncbi:MAG: 4-hydroxy-tetrahydrodipicolinate synthase [Candidatus Latescibacterota bacterium]|jgi:4-hydroxy-tetrahydrodipicolinate synthase
MFYGTYTALITPFTAEGQLDAAGLEALVEFQIEQGISGLVPTGTTGESPTLLDRERYQVVEHVCNRAAGRVQVIAGAGSNSTAHALDYCRHAAEHGADGALLVDPYYNGPSSL